MKPVTAKQLKILQILVNGPAWDSFNAYRGRSYFLGKPPIMVYRHEIDRLAALGLISRQRTVGRLNVWRPTESGVRVVQRKISGSSYRGGALMARTLSNQIFTGDSSPSPARAGLVPEAGPTTQECFHEFDGEGVQKLDSAGRAHGNSRLVTSPSIQDSLHTTTQGAVIPTVVHVTQGSAPESDRHPQNSPTLDGNEERNGCVAQMDMPLNHAAVAADESRASADERTSDENLQSGSARRHDVFQSERPSGSAAEIIQDDRADSRETPEVDSSAGVGRSRGRRNSITSFPPSLCTLAEKESYGERAAMGKDEGAATSREANGRQVNIARQDCGSAEALPQVPQISVSKKDAEGDDQPVRLLTLSSPQGEDEGLVTIGAPLLGKSSESRPTTASPSVMESGAEQGALVSALEFDIPHPVAESGGRYRFEPGCRGFGPGMDKRQVARCELLDSQSSGLSASAGQRTQCESGAGKDHDGHTPAMESSVTDPAPEISNFVTSVSDVSEHFPSPEHLKICQPCADEIWRAND